MQTPSCLTLSCLGADLLYMQWRLLFHVQTPTLLNRCTLHRMEDLPVCTKSSLALNWHGLGLFKWKNKTTFLEGMFISNIGYLIHDNMCVFTFVHIWILSVTSKCGGTTSQHTICAIEGESPWLSLHKLHVVMPCLHLRVLNTPNTVKVWRHGIRASNLCNSYKSV